MKRLLFPLALISSLLGRGECTYKVWRWGGAIITSSETSPERPTQAV